MRRWLDRLAERRDERARDRYERGYVVAGAYIGNRTPGARVFPEVGLPAGFEPPSASLWGPDVMDVPPPVPSSRTDAVPDDYDG